jgi:hypothetical protein
MLFACARVNPAIGYRNGDFVLQNSTIALRKLAQIEELELE